MNDQTNIVTGPTLFKRDTSGRVRVWRAERQDHCHRVVSGLQDGKLVESGWTVCEATNVGRSNERDPVAQCDFEVRALYEFNVSRDYHASVDTIDEPKFFEPMLAKKYEGFEPGFAQPKLDGVRCIARATGLFTRQGKPISSCPHIVEALAPLFAADPDLILDGELYNHALKDDFNEIISLVRKAKPKADDLQATAAKVQYHVYDMPSHPSDFHNRFKSLVVSMAASSAGTAFAEGNVLVMGPVRTVLTKRVETADDFDALHGEWLTCGFEGSMWRADAPYEQKRSKHLLKRKEFQDAEYECVRIEEGLGNWAGLAKRVVCRLPDGREFGAGIKGNMARAKELLSETHNVVTVQFFQLTPDGIPRFPVVTKFWGAERTL
jgi:DNA ligase-1